MSIKGNFVFNVLLTTSQVVFPLVTFPYAANILGAEGIGVVSFIDSFCRYFMLTAALGIPIYGIREIAKCRESISERSKVFFEIFTIHIISTSVVLLAYLLVIFSFDFAKNYYEFYTLGIIYVFANVFSIEWFFNGISNFKFLAIRSFLVRVVGIIVLFFLVRDSKDTIWYFSLNIMMLVGNNLINVFVLFRYIRFDNTIIKIQNLNLKVHLKPIFYIFSTSIAVSVYVLIDTLLLGFLTEDKYVGYYSLVSRINKVPITLITALGTVLIPELTKSLKDDSNFQTFTSLINKSTQFVVIIAVPISVFLFVCSKQIIQLFGGKDFLSATFAMQIMTSVSLLVGLSNVFGMQILTPLSKDKLLLKCILLGTISSLVLNLFLIPGFNVLGAVIANMISEVIVLLATGYVSFKIIKYNLPYRDIVFQYLCYLPVILLSLILAKFVVSYMLFIIIMFLVIIIFFISINLYILKTSVVVDFYKKIRLKF